MMVIIHDQTRSKNAGDQYPIIHTAIVVEFPYGVEVIIRRFHRRDLGSIPGRGTFLYSWSDWNCLSVRH